MSNTSNGTTGASTATGGQDAALSTLFPDLAPIAQRFDSLVDVGKSLRTAMLVLAGALVLHTVVLIATRPTR